MQLRSRALGKCHGRAVVVHLPALGMCHVRAGARACAITARFHSSNIHHLPIIFGINTFLIMGTNSPRIFGKKFAAHTKRSDPKK